MIKIVVECRGLNLIEVRRELGKSYVTAMPIMLGASHAFELAIDLPDAKRDDTAARIASMCPDQYVGWIDADKVAQFKKEYAQKETLLDDMLAESGRSYPQSKQELDLDNELSFLRRRTLQDAFVPCPASAKRAPADT